MGINDVESNIKNDAFKRCILKSTFNLNNSIHFLFKLTNFLEQSFSTSILNVASYSLCIFKCYYILDVVDGRYLNC